MKRLLRLLLFCAWRLRWPTEILQDLSAASKITSCLTRLSQALFSTWAWSRSAHADTLQVPTWICCRP